MGPSDQVTLRVSEKRIFDHPCFWLEQLGGCKCDL